MVGAPIYLGILCMTETSKAQILKPKREAGSFTAAHAWARTKHHLRNGVLRPTKMLMAEPIVLSLTIYTAYAYAMIFSFFGSLPYVLELDYGFDSRQIGLAFLSVIIGYLLATCMFGIFDRTLVSYPVLWYHVSFLSVCSLDSSSIETAATTRTRKRCQCN